MKVGPSTSGFTGVRISVQSTSLKGFMSIKIHLNYLWILGVVEFDVCSPNEL